MNGGVRVGEVVHYYNRIGVAVVRLDGDLALGDQVHFLGHTTDFLQEVRSMQIEHQPIERASAGTEVAVKVDRRVRRGDRVFKLTDEA